MTSTYWEIGRRIVEAEQQGKRRAGYGDALIKRLAIDLTAQFGRGFGWRNLFQMRAFYLAWTDILQTASAMSAIEMPSDQRLQTAPALSETVLSLAPSLAALANRFPLPWSAYVRLLSVRHDPARQFYEAEALRSGWSVRQLDRQVDSQFYERVALSRNKASMLSKGAVAKPEDLVAAEEAIKDPYVLEFLELKDEYSESQLEAALIERLETFLPELGGDFAFIGRQRRMRIDDAWFRVDLLLFNRRLRCLVVIDLKIGSFTHADGGQMHMYLNYAREHWTLPGENPPVGLILCASTSTALARYALEGLPNKVLAAEYRTALPDEAVLAAELDKSRRLLAAPKPGPKRQPVVQSTLRGGQSPQDWHQTDTLLDNAKAIAALLPAQHSSRQFNTPVSAQALPARTRPFPTLSSDLSSDGRTDHPESLGEGLFELRLKGAEAIARVSFCTLIRRRIVMLHSFVKKTKKTPLREIEIARKRMQEIKDENS